MNARELIQNLKTHIEIENGISDTEIKVDIIGNSLEAKANVAYEVEGKMKIIEVVARALE